jgi:PAS domain S-box-containing protein/putative nucleotidyltransferase with HDIG domain
MKVFYVEDNPDDLDLARRVLNRQHPDISLETSFNCAGAVERLDRLESEPLDVLLTDMRLPDGDGLSLLDHIRQRNLPLAVVILTGSGDEETAVAALKAGADDYVVKRPGYLSSLAPVLCGALERFRAETSRHAFPLRLLYADYSAQDIASTRRHLAAHAPNIRMDIASSGMRAFEMALQQDYDVLLLDYRLPDMSGLSVLKELRALGKDTPVVMVTGEGNQEAALLALRLGASDYILKNPGYLDKIPAVLESAFHQAQMMRERAALQQSEKRFRLLAENARDVIYRLRLIPALQVEYVSPSVQKFTGYTPAEFYADPGLICRVIDPDDLPKLKERLITHESINLRWVHKAGHTLSIELSTTTFLDEQGQLVALEGIAHDITERRRGEEERQRLYLELAHSHQELIKSYDATIEGWSRALDLRDRATEYHSEQVVDLTLALARKLGLPETDLPHLRRGALLHDIGKLAISDTVLNKNGPLTEEEWVQMRLHPEYAYQVLKPIAFLAPSLDIAHYHHERWDGCGYPEGLAGAEIPFAARLFAIVDVYEALSSARPYRPEWTKERILTYLASQSGRQFDPAVVKAFLEILV